MLSGIILQQLLNIDFIELIFHQMYSIYVLNTRWKKYDMIFSPFIIVLNVNTRVARKSSYLVDSELKLLWNTVCA